MNIEKLRLPPGTAGLEPAVRPPRPRPNEHYMKGPVPLAWLAAAARLPGAAIDPQVRAEQMGHTVDVNQNVYTRSSLVRRIEAVNAIEEAVTVN